MSLPPKPEGWINPGVLKWIASQFNTIYGNERVGEVVRAQFNDGDNKTLTLTIGKKTATFDVDFRVLESEVRLYKELSPVEEV